MPFRSRVERTTGASRIVVRGQRTLAGKAGKNAKGVNALGEPAGNGQVALVPSCSICMPWIKPRIARSTGGTDRVVGAGDAQVQM